MTWNEGNWWFRLGQQVTAWGRIGILVWFMVGLRTAWGPEPLKAFLWLWCAYEIVHILRALRRAWPFGDRVYP